MEAAARRARTGYVSALLVLVTLTALELGVIRLEIDHAARVTALCGLAIAKVSTLLWVFMDLRARSWLIKVLALSPLLLAPGFTVVLMLDVVHRTLGAR